MILHSILFSKSASVTYLLTVLPLISYILKILLSPSKFSVRHIHITQYDGYTRGYLAASLTWSHLCVFEWKVLSLSLFVWSQQPIWTLKKDFRVYSGSLGWSPLSLFLRFLLLSVWLQVAPWQILLTKRHVQLTSYYLLLYNFRCYSTLKSVLIHSSYWGFV